MNEERKIETESVEAVSPPPRARVPDSVQRKRDYLTGFFSPASFDYLWFTPRATREDPCKS